MSQMAISPTLVALPLLLFSGASGTTGQEWHSVTSPFCSQIKAKGAMVSFRQFSVYEATGDAEKCCDGLPMKLKGKTEQFGYFKLWGLERHRYFVAFDLGKKQVSVPIYVDRVFPSKNCEPQSRITVEEGTNRLAWEEWINVD